MLWRRFCKTSIKNDKKRGSELCRRTVKGEDVDGQEESSEMDSPHAEENPDGQVKGEVFPAEVTEAREQELQELVTRVHVEVDEAEAWKGEWQGPDRCALG